MLGESNRRKKVGIFRELENVDAYDIMPDDIQAVTVVVEMDHCCP